MLMAQAEVAVAVAAASQATAASAAACANVTKVETAVAAEHSAGIDATAIEAALVQTKKDCDTATALAKNLTEAAHALNATMWAKLHNETAIEIRKKRYEEEMVERRIEPWRWPWPSPTTPVLYPHTHPNQAKKQQEEQRAYDATMDADIAENTAHEAAKVNTTKNFTATMNTVAVIKPGHVGPVTEEEKAEIAEEVAKEVHDVGIKDEIGDEVTTAADLPTPLTLTSLAPNPSPVLAH